MNSGSRQSARGEHVTHEGHSFDKVEAGDAIGVRHSGKRRQASVLTDQLDISGDPISCRSAEAVAAIPRITVVD